MAFPFLSPSLLFLLLAICLCCCPTAAQAALDDPTHQGCVHLPIIHSTNVNVFNRRAVELQLANRSDVAYYAELNIGTPAQPVFVQLDTGSFELWVNPQCSSLSFSDASFCEMTGSYSPTRSSTSDDLRTNKFLQYGIGQANVTYFKDTINIPGSTTTLKQVQFGVAFATKDQFAGILGIGYGLGFTTTYPNFLDQLALQNATKVKAFSLALGSKDAQEGVIVFGGVDTAKFSGPLARLPIIPANESPDGVPRYWVQLDSVTLTPASGKTLPAYANSSMPVFLDSGSTMTLLPTALADAIASDFGSAGVDADGFYQVQCDLTGLSGSLDFMFNGTIVKVPYSEMIRTVDSPPSCFLGIMPSDSFTLLGDTFLRSAYAVFDLDSNVVWMTQAANCGSQPAAIASASTLATVTGSCSSTADDATNSGTSASATTTASGTTSTGNTDAASSGRRSIGMDQRAAALWGASVVGILVVKVFA